MKSLKIPLISFLVLMAIGFALNFGVNAYIQLSIIYIFVNIILSMSLNLVNGYTGQFSLGHAGFMAVGAYSSAFLSTQFAPFSGALSFFNFFMYAVISGSVAAFAGYIVGLPSLRLKGDYLAIVTLGFGEIIRVTLLNMQSLGGARGFYGIAGPVDLDLGGFTLSKFLVGYTHSVLWVLICLFTIWRLVQSTHGRGFQSVREDEIAAEAMGIDTTQMKVRSFVLSSFFAGVAGSIFAHYANYLNPSTFSFVLSVNVIVMVVLGGLGSMSGAIIGGIFVTILPELLRPLQEITGVDLRMVIFSFSLILVMILKPSGIFGNVELPDLWRKYVSRKSS